jgi:hypothetical protein
MEGAFLRHLADTTQKGDARVVAVGLARNHARFPESGAPYLRVVTYTSDGMEMHDELTLAASPQAPEA